jgi:hypothetical protein
MKDRPEFILDCTVSNPLTKPTYHDYNALKDKNLRGYFNEPRRNHLLNNNIVIFLFRYLMKVLL